MKEEIGNELVIERIAKESFGLLVTVDQIILRSIPVSHTATATVFVTAKKQLFVYIHARSKQTLADVKKIILRMGLRPEVFVPPAGDAEYFDDIARGNYAKVFPGKHNPTGDDLRYYRTLAPYNPALVQISEVPTGEISQFDTDAHSNWRVATRYAYRRIPTKLK